MILGSVKTETIDFVLEESVSIESSFSTFDDEMMYGEKMIDFPACSSQDPENDPLAILSCMQASFNKV